MQRRAFLASSVTAAASIGEDGADEGDDDPDGDADANPAHDAGGEPAWAGLTDGHLGPRRDDDGQALVVVSAIAVTALGLDTLGAIAAVAEWFDEPRDPPWYG